MNSVISHFSAYEIDFENGKFNCRSNDKGTAKEGDGDKNRVAWTDPVDLKANLNASLGRFD